LRHSVVIVLTDQSW